MPLCHASNGHVKLKLECQCLFLHVYCSLATSSAPYKGIANTRGILLADAMVTTKDEMQILMQPAWHLCCTNLRRFARPGKMPAEPYFELPISLSKLRRLMQFGLGSHGLPIEQGHMARPVVPR